MVLSLCHFHICKFYSNKTKKKSKLGREWVRVTEEAEMAGTVMKVCGYVL